MFLSPSSAGFDRCILRGLPVHWTKRRIKRRKQMTKGGADLKGSSIQIPPALNYERNASKCSPLYAVLKWHILHMNSLSLKWTLFR